MFERFLHTENDVAPLILRVAAGGVVLMHGFQKFLGWFGGHGPTATMEAFAQWFGLPYALTFLVILSDFFGALFLIAGVLTRFVSATIGMVMIGAMVLVHGRWGFYMNWYGEPRGEGIEFHLLILAMTVVLMIRGGGKWSFDRFLLRKTREAGARRISA